MEVLNSKTLIDSNISHNDFVLINNMLKGFYDMKEGIENSNKKWKFRLYIKQWYRITWSVEKCRKFKSKTSEG